jgi:hypothetical protein
VVYSDNPGRRFHRRVKRRIPPAASRPEDAKARYIRKVAAQYPKFTADEVHAEIYYGRGRHDISKDMVRKVLAQPRPTPQPRPRTPLWPFGR